MQRRYLLCDASVLTDLLLPKLAHSPKAEERITTIVEAVRKRCREDLTLYVPNICIAEVFSNLMKHAYGRWNKKQVKQKLDLRRYKTLRKRFREYIHNGTVMTQLELNRYHILAADLIAPIDHRFQLRARKKNPVPMGAHDHLIIAMGIVLNRTHGRENVAIVTADDRMVRATNRAQTLNENTAKQLALPKLAKELGYEWRPELYPRMLYLPKATNAELTDFFGEWPLPTAGRRGVVPRATAL